jgi:uncharacterized membrane protein YkvI
MLQEFSNWLTQTDLNAFLSDTTHVETWLIIPVSQSVHILGVAVVMISVAVLNLKLLGFAGGRQTFAQLASRLMPWIWGGMIALFLTGVIQTLAEPGRELLNISFQIKVALLVMVVAITLFYQQALKRDAAYWENSPEHRQMGRFLASVSLMLWIGIAVAGRLIAYLDMRTENIS